MKFQHSTAECMEVVLTQLIQERHKVSAAIEAMERVIEIDTALRMYRAALGRCQQDPLCVIVESHAHPVTAEAGTGDRNG